MQQSRFDQVGFIGLKVERDQATLKASVYTQICPKYLALEEITMRSSEMMMGRVKMVAVAAVFIVASGFSVANAQQGMPGMTQGGDMPMGHEGMSREGMGHEGMMGPGMMMCHMGGHIDGKLAYLKTELKITEAQTPQWNAFADAFRASGQKMAQQCATMKEHGGSMMSADLPERLNMMEQHMTMRLDSLRAIKATLQPLYAVLSDEQKKIANEIMKGPMGMM
jgi:LTXXQ motif family protein